MWIVQLAIHFETESSSNSAAVEGNLTVEVEELLVLPVDTVISAIPDENGEFTYNVSFQIPKVRNHP